MWDQIYAIPRSIRSHFGFFSLFGANLEFAGKLVDKHAAFLEQEGCVFVNGPIWQHEGVGWEPPTLEAYPTKELQLRLAEVSSGKQHMFTQVRFPGAPTSITKLVKELDARLAEEISAFYTSMEFEAPRSTPRVDTDVVLSLLHELRDDYLPNILRGGEPLHKPAVVTTDDKHLRRLLRVISSD